MKKYRYILTLLMVAFFAEGLYTSCTKENSSGGGTPSISYIRVPRPQSADSMITAAFQGEVIAIIGTNLGTVTQVWFDNEQAYLTPTYITNTCIEVQVPSTAATVVTNKMKLVFSSGETLYYDFSITISKPTLNYMTCEYVNDGDTAIINGANFYAPIAVYFPGITTPAVIDSIGLDELKVTVPIGSQPGQITVVDNFGTTKSNFFFRDNRNIILDGSPIGWYTSYSVSSTSPVLNGPSFIGPNYLYLNNTFQGGWSWYDIAGGDSSSMAPFSANYPQEAFVHPELYYLKFEVNTLVPYSQSALEMFFATPGPGGTSNGEYTWPAPYNTQGKWQTVVIDFDTFLKGFTGHGSMTRLAFQDPASGTMIVNMALDNFRIVPRTILGNDK